MDTLPHIPPDLLEALEKRFPDKCPDPRMTDREIWMSVGERQVVRLLQRIFNEQNENIMRPSNVQT